MSSFYLNRTTGISDIKCPKCGAGYDITWNTEYGDPMYGGENAECEECEAKFQFYPKLIYTTHLLDN